ncbi:hypothetical protein MYIN104542_00225 [Mycobacterium intermedium]
MVSPVWMIASIPPPKLAARFDANVAPVCTRPFKPPLNAATNPGRPLPKLAEMAAFNWAAKVGRLPPKLASRVPPVCSAVPNDPPRFVMTLAVTVCPA